MIVECSNGVVADVPDSQNPRCWRERLARRRRERERRAAHHAARLPSLSTHWTGCASVHPDCAERERVVPVTVGGPPWR